MLLRRFEPGDLETVARWNADPRFMRHMGRPPMTFEETTEALERHQQHWRDHGFGLLGVVERATGELIGRSGPQYHRAWPGDPEVGWSFDPSRWGNGFATEAGGACVEWAFGELGFTRVVSITTEENLASRRVMAKLGFELHEVVAVRELGLDLLVHMLEARTPRVVWESRSRTSVRVEEPADGAGRLRVRAP